MICKRFALGLCTLFIVSVIIFLSVELLPGDVAQALLGQGVTPENTAALRIKLGLDFPPHTRYINWLSRFIQGDFGISLTNNRPIAEMINLRFSNTVFLATVAALTTIPLAIILGLLAALYRNRIFDRIINLTTLTTISTPDFFIGYVVIVIFSVKLGWTPPISLIYEHTPFFERLARVALPALTLTAISLAYMMRLVRASIINLLSSDYIEMADIKGMPKPRIILYHALPNAWGPIAHIAALTLAYLITGVVIVEVVFAYPGLGTLIINAVSSRDIPVVQACSLIFSAVYILFNLVADIIAIATNPRLLYPK